jgi:hypothetical protein
MTGGGDMDQERLADANRAGPPTEPAYAYKPSLMGAPWEFRLQPERLVWSAGSRTGSILYTDIRRVRLSYRPVSMQSHRFIAEIWSAGAPKLTIASTSWRGMLDQERLDRPYCDFIVALHERIAAVGGDAALEIGSPPYLYWPGLVLFALVAIGIAALLVRSLQQEFWAATLFLAGFFALLLWQIGGFFRRNRPRRYDARAIPDDILPVPKS